MKNRANHIIALLLALFFLVAGSGINVVKFCCDICSEHGIEEVALKSCSSFHHHERDCCKTSNSHDCDTDSDMACSDISHQTNGCHILRLKVETPVLVDGAAEFVFPTDFLAVFHFIHADLVLCAENEILPTHSPPNYIFPSGREILSQKSVLII
ncbi:MAG: hypothetical protein ACOYM7_02360 [Paludibacter sp.]